jgi:hypothetical protein
LPRRRVITAPADTLEGDANGAPDEYPRVYEAEFSGRYLHRTIAGGIGYKVPQKAPEVFARAIVVVDGAT